MFDKSKATSKSGNFLGNFLERFWEDTEHGVPYGSILGTLLFNIFICGMFLILDQTYFASYVDNNTPYTVNENAEEVIRTLKEITKPLLK